MIVMNKEILEGNKLIAVFMGWSQQLDVEERWYGAWFDQHGVRKAWHEFQGYEPLLFNESWDWLMPVLERIRVKGYKWEIGMSPISSQYHYCKIWSVGTIGGRSPLDAVYSAVLEFIKWYNSIK